MSDVRYFIDGRWQSRGDIINMLAKDWNSGSVDPYVEQWADQIIQNYNAGEPGYGLRRDPATGTVIPFEHTYDENNPPPDPYWTGEEYAPIEMSGGYGDETLMGGRKGYADPVSGTWAAKSSSPFGASRSMGRRLHAGNDLQAPNGSEAVATIGGKVIYAGHNQGYQWNAVVLGDDGNAYRYATHGPLNVKIGDRVEQGQPVGTIARGHLHFEVIPPGPTLDQMVAAAAKNAFVGTSWKPGQAPRTVDPASFFDMDRGEVLQVGDIFEDRAALPVSRVASELDVEPSWPSAREAVRMLAERGYAGRTAVADFQRDELLRTRPSGSMDAETISALMNPTMLSYAPTQRPPVVAGSSGTDTFGGRTDTLLGGLETPSEFAGPLPRPRPALAAPSPKPSAGLGAVTPRSAPRGLPAPSARPSGLGTAGQELPGGYRRLRVGDEGEDVRTVQSQLTAAGFDPGPLDGKYGPRTAKAVLSYQRATPDLKPDAVAGPWTQASLYDRTQNSTLASLRDPGGVPGGSPSGLDVARTLGRPLAVTSPVEFDPGGGTGRDSRPPGTAPATERVTTSGVPLTQHRPEAWSHPYYKQPDRQPWSQNTMELIEETPGGMRGVTVVPATPERTTPSPLSPVNVVATMGGTGGSGLGPAGPGSPGVTESTWSSDDDEENTSSVSGYNESFSTTGWL